MAWYGARYVKETWLHGYLTSLLTGHTCHCPGCSRIHNSLLFETLNPQCLLVSNRMSLITRAVLRDKVAETHGFISYFTGVPVNSPIQFCLYGCQNWAPQKCQKNIKKSAQTPENSTHLILSPMKSRSPHCTKANFSESSPTRCTARVQTDDSAQRRPFQTSGWATWLGCYRRRDSTDSTGSMVK